ncbi:uncharacterized protein [Parasteatoda tepidariorum]|uniref:uncharacterized protein n=1 Tax=Parasteatoda tepidariorum TaxID=114398 RepID=UPI0039BC47D1
MEDSIATFELEDLEFLETVERREIYVQTIRNNDLEELDEIDFFERYRFLKPTTEELISKIGSQLESDTDRNNALTPTEKILAAVRFYTFENQQINLGDTQKMSQPSVSRIISEVSQCLAELRPQYIYLPQSEAERMETWFNFSPYSGCNKALYNSTHASARNVVERQYGIWKRRFACLDAPLRCKLQNVQKIIVATAVLHNLALTMGDHTEEKKTDYKYAAAKENFLLVLEYDCCLCLSLIDCQFWR